MKQSDVDGRVRPAGALNRAGLTDESTQLLTLAAADGYAVYSQQTVVVRFSPSETKQPLGGGGVATVSSFRYVYRLWRPSAVAETNVL